MGAEPVTSADAPHTITQLPKATLISFTPFPGTGELNKRTKRNPYFSYFIFGGHGNEISEINETLIPFISLISFSVS